MQSPDHVTEYSLLWCLVHGPELIPKQGVRGSSLAFDPRLVGSLVYSKPRFGLRSCFADENANADEQVGADVLG